MNSEDEENLRSNQDDESPTKFNKNISVSRKGSKPSSINNNTNNIYYENIPSKKNSLKNRVSLGENPNINTNINFNQNINDSNGNSVNSPNFNNAQEFVYQNKRGEVTSEIYNNSNKATINSNNRLISNDINNNIHEQEKINENLIPVNDQESKKTKKTRLNQNPMERISEVEYEDDKYTTIFDKINEEAQKNDYRINDDNYNDLVDKNITSENVKYLFNPTLFDTEESKNKFQPEINKHSKLIMEEKDRNKSNDNSQRSKIQPIEVNYLYKFFLF